MEKDIFELFYETTKACEETDGTPLFICGVFANTAGCEVLDVEFVSGGGAILYGDADVKAFLFDCGVTKSSFMEQLKVAATEYGVGLEEEW